MTKLAIAINQTRCIGCQTCAFACKMQNGVPEGMRWNRVLTEGCDVEDGARGTFPNLGTHLHCPSRASTARTRHACACARRAPRTKTTRAASRLTTTSASAAACAWRRAPTTPACSTGASRSTRPISCTATSSVPARRKGVAEKCTLCKERTDRGEEPMCVACCSGQRPRHLVATWTDPEKSRSSQGHLRRRHGYAAASKSRARSPQVHYFRIREVFAMSSKLKAAYGVLGAVDDCRHLPPGFTNLWAVWP